jgi:IS6 family transposase
MRTRRFRRAAIPRSAFAGFCFPPDVIVLAVRWYLRYGLSHRDLEELLAERGIQADHVTIYRWLLRFTPLLADAARPCRHRVGDRWQVDERYVKVAGQWRYVYRAIDQFGQVIDVFASPRRDAKAAYRFFEQAIGTTKIAPAEVTTDQAPVYPPVADVGLQHALGRRNATAPARAGSDRSRQAAMLRLAPASGLILGRRAEAMRAGSWEPSWSPAARGRPGSSACRSWSGRRVVQADQDGDAGRSAQRAAWPDRLRLLPVRGRHGRS